MSKQTLFNVKMSLLHEFFRSKGETGSLYDMMYAHFENLSGLTEGTLFDHIDKVMTDLGHTGTMQDKLNSFFIDQTGINHSRDAERSFFSDTSNSFGSSDASPTWVDAVVDAGGGGDYTTLSDAESGLTGPFTVLVKGGQSYAGATLSKQGYWIFEPGCTITSTITCQTAATAIEGLSGADFRTDNSAIVFSVNDCYLSIRNGADLDGLSWDDPNNIYFSGGGWGTVSYSRTIVTTTASDPIVKNYAIDTKADGSGLRGIYFNQGNRGIIDGVKVIDADDSGIRPRTANSTLVLGSMVLDQDTASTVRGLTRYVGCYINSPASGIDGIAAESPGDDSVIAGNIIQVGTGSTVDFSSGEDNNVLVGNRLDGAASDSGTSNTIASNEETAF